MNLISSCFIGLVSDLPTPSIPSIPQCSQLSILLRGKMPFSECFPSRAPGVGGGEGVSSLTFPPAPTERVLYIHSSVLQPWHTSVALLLSHNDCIPVTEMPRTDLPNWVSGAQALGCESQTRPQALPRPWWLAQALGCPLFSSLESMMLKLSKARGSGMLSREQPVLGFSLSE